jgi:hypothetical protein
MLITTNMNTPNGPDVLIVDGDVSRDLFAALTLAGMLAMGKRMSGVDDAASLAYDCADAMLRARVVQKP